MTAPPAPEPGKKADILDRLAEKAGIEEGWWDFFGEYRHVPAGTKKALLAAMGFDVADEERMKAALFALDTAPWRRPLAPVEVAGEEDGPPVIALTLPESLAGRALSWTLDEEIGARHRGVLVAGELPLLARREIDGVRLERRGFRFPAMPQLGIHRFRLSLPGEEAGATLIVAPGKAWLPAPMEEGHRLWGFATQLYALSGEQSWGMGDFSDLARFGRDAAGLGASFVGVNPLHALFPGQPERFSPYSPSSRRLLNVLCIDVEAVPEFSEEGGARTFLAKDGHGERLSAARARDLIDYAASGTVKMEALEACWSRFRDHCLDRPDSRRGREFASFLDAGGQGIETLAIFEALREHFQSRDPAQAYWRRWPAAYRDPHGEAVARFANTVRERVLFFLYLQWLADQQLAAAQDACVGAGMPVGVYRDLGVGITDDGAEAWANQALLCPGVSVGAPPDPLNLAGQDWGLSPFNPFALKEAAYRPFLDILEANMAHAGAMRLDHAMSLERLYWVPEGARADQGAYVRYPADDLFRLVALASRRRHCLVVGEDLGTVPEGFRERMEERGILGYRLMVFEKDKGGSFKAPADLAGKAMVGVGTHDLPSLAGWWQGIDNEARERLGIYPNEAMGPQERRLRAADRAALVAALLREGLLDPDFPIGGELDLARLGALAFALHRYLDRAPSLLLMIRPEDVLGLALQMNLPGTTDEHPNWRARYPATVPEMLRDRRMLDLAKALKGRSFHPCPEPGRKS